MEDMAVLWDDGALKVYRQHKEAYGEFRAFDGVSGSCIDWSSSGRSVALGGCDDSSVTVVATSGKTMLRLERAARDGVSSVLFGVHNYLFVGSEEGIVRVWSAQVSECRDCARDFS